jgi:hypothetical protein
MSEIEQLIARENALSMFGECQQEFKLATRRGDESNITALLGRFDVQSFVVCVMADTFGPY